MPNWKKVIVSGSDAYLRNITASSDISASGLLHASLSFDTTPVTDGVVVYDTAGGRFYYTGSYGGGSGGGTIVIKEDGVTTVAAATTIDFLNSIITESPSGEANVAFDLQGVTDSGAVTSNGSLFLHNQNSSYGFSNSQLAKSGFAIDNSKAYTYATPQRTQNDVYLLGMHITANGVGPYPDNFITLNKDLVYNGGSGPYDGGGGGTNPDTDHPDDLGGTLISTGTGFQVLASSSISSITKDNKARGIYITPSAFYMFNTDASASVSGTLVPESASAQIKFNTGSSAVEIFAGDTTTDLINVLHISRSDNQPTIGIGTSLPLTSLDIRSVTSSDPANIILRTNEDGDIQVGEETGRIIFAIESASFLGNNFIASGSTSAIYSEVIGSSINGAYGGLIFEVNDSSDVTTPIKALTMGYGLGASSNDVGFIFSGSIKSTAGANSLSLLSSTNDNTLAYLGFSGVSDLPEFDRGMLLLNDDGNTHVRLNGAAGSTDFLNTGNNVAIGTTTAPEKLTVEGNISSSGEIIADTGNFAAITSSNLQILGTASIAYFETLYETSSIIYSSGSTKFGDTMDDFHDFTGSVDITGSITTSGDLSLLGGTIDLKNSGAASKILLYCESNNAHAQTIQAAPHSDVASNTLILPSTGTKFATQDGAETFTNKTLTSPDINTPDIDGGNIDNTVIGNSTANAGTFTSLTATNANITGAITASAFSGSELRIPQDGTGLRMTNVGAFDNDSGDFRIFANNSLKFSTNGDSNTRLTIDQTTGDASFTGNITSSGNISASGDITSNTFETISTTLASDAITNVDTFATSTYNGAIYDYILKDSTVGARAGQFMVAHDDGDVTFTDTSTKHLSDSTIPEITADINGADVRVRVTNGNGYTFKSFVKKL